MKIGNQCVIEHSEKDMEDETKVMQDENFISIYIQKYWNVELPKLDTDQRSAIWSFILDGHIGERLEKLTKIDNNSLI